MKALAWLNDQWQKWWRSRQLQGNSLRLSHRNIYILPSQAGLMLCATLTLLLIGAINYQLSLGYLLTFLLAGCSVVSMRFGHANLLGLEVSALKPQACFCGDTATLSLRFVSGSSLARYAIGARFVDDRQWNCFDVPAQGACEVQLEFRTSHRGLMPVPALTVQSRFPMGAFRVWSLWQPAMNVLVYPKPEADPPPLPTTESEGPSSATSDQSALGDFEGVRNYRRGDSLKRIVWKKVAHHDQLVSREDLGDSLGPLWLDLSLAGSGPLEQKLSRLCAWVLDAHHRGIAVGLRLPGQETAPSKGQDHLLRCLDALARCSE